MKDPQLTKEAKEFIDRICEHDAPVIDNGIFVTDEARIKEDTHIAEIAALVSQTVIGNEYMGDNLDYIKDSLSTLSRIVSTHFRIVRILNWEIEQRRRQMLNLEARLFTLEERLGKRGRGKYKQYEG